MKDIVADERPREKLLDRGPESLSTSELLAVLLRNGKQGTNVLDLAQNIMMEAVKNGGDRQELHEKIRVHSMAAGKVVKVDGGENYEAVFAPMKVNIDGTGGIAVFNVNGVPYEIDRLSSSEYVMAPAVDFNCKLLLEAPGKLATSPNGNGGWFLSMEKMMK